VATIGYSIFTFVLIGNVFKNTEPKTVQIYLEADLVQHQVVVKSHGHKGRVTVRKSNFTCVDMENISQYDSGEQFGPWAFCF
jgi:hypothetical protein